MASSLQNAVQFFQEFGLFDVVLPFLLVFTIVFAILEKTRVLGTEKIKNEEHPRKNLNAVVAFVVGMLVVAANKVVDAIGTALPNIVLLIVIVVVFLMLVGTFYKTGELESFASKHDRWTTFFMFALFIIIVLIFAGSIKKTLNQSYLSFIIEYAIENFTGTIVTSILFLAVAIGAIFYVTAGGGKAEGKS